MRRHAIWIVALAGMSAPIVFNQADPATTHFSGQVVPLSEIVAKAGGKMDADAAQVTLVFKTDDGKLLSVVKDDGSRMFYLDKRLLSRPMRLTAKLIPGSQILQVVEVHSLKDSALHEIYYWCDICIIKRYEKKLCDCCGDPMELRETPLAN